jgi:hypothetical protein
MIRKFTIFGLCVAPLLLISGCVSAPVQEMSDARQAILAAKETGAKPVHPSLAKAESLLKEAEMALEIGEYKKAKLTATEARNEALKAQRALP